MAHVKKSGYYFRQPYAWFLQRYKMLSPVTWPHWAGVAIEGVARLLRDLPISATEYAFGRRKLFIKHSCTVLRFFFLERTIRFTVIGNCRTIFFCVCPGDSARGISQDKTVRVGHPYPENLPGMGGQDALPQAKAGSDPNCYSVASLQGYYPYDLFIFSCSVGARVHFLN